MGIHQSKEGTARQERKSGKDDKAVRYCTAAAFRAIDARNVNKLRKALAVSAVSLNVRRLSISRVRDSTRSMSLLEYAVDKNFLSAVDIMLKTSSSSVGHDADSVTAAFMRSCDNGYLRLGIFNLFVDAAIEGRIQLDLHAIYHQLVDHFMYRKPYDLARRPPFDIAALDDVNCRITPLGLAVIHGDASVIKSFAMRGADVNSYDRDGNTALLRAGYSLKRDCLHMLLLLGADPNRRSCKRVNSPTSSMSPLVSVCLAYGHYTGTRASLIAELIACGADPSADRMWFAQDSVVSGGTGSITGVPPRCVLRRLDDGTRLALAELCLQPRRLQTLCASAVRKCLAAAERNGVINNTDSLPLPSTIKAKLKLELNDM